MKIVTVNICDGDEYMPVWMSALDLRLVDEFILLDDGRPAAKLVRLDYDSTAVDSERLPEQREH